METQVHTNVKPKPVINVNAEAEKKAKPKKAKKEATPKAEKVPMTPKQWLSSYIGGDNIARTVTKKLAEGATIPELMGVAADYNKAKGGKEKWGEKAGEIRSHFAWLKAKGLTIEEVEDGKFKVTAS